jgi:hypothetical protein
MRDFLEQVQGGLDCNLYYLALFAAVAIPDICGALDSDDGYATKAKYIGWFDEYVAPRYRTPSGPILTGEDCYFFRCSLLHQGSLQHPQSSFSRVLFLEPGTSTNTLHRNIMMNALNIDVRIFCQDMLSGAYEWLEKAEDTDRFRENSSRFMRRYPEGLAPYYVGSPVIS